MAQYRGTIQGNRGEASRLGTKKSGLDVEAGSWEGGATIRLWYDRATNQDMIKVALIPWEGQGTTRLLYYGPANGKGEEI